jgi:hypothetical protein
MISNRIFIGFILLTLFIYSCNIADCVKLEKKFSALDCPVNEKCNISINTLFPGTWDSIYIFHSETTGEDIFEQIGIRIDQYVYDGEQLVIYINHGKISKTMKIYCRRFDFYFLEPSGPTKIYKSEPIYSIKMNIINGKSIYYLSKTSID